MPRLGFVLALAVGGCARPAPAPAPQPNPPAPVVRATADAQASVAIPDASTAVRQQIDPDGNDETEGSTIALPEHGHFVNAGRHWAALQRLCDFSVKDGALYMTHATEPLGLGGATITRFDPKAKTPFTLVFDWNRPGEPETGGAGGQGFLRIRQIGGRFFVPDADPPYLGLGLAFGVEGYVFESDAAGNFPGARRPGHLPPGAPNADHGGAIILPGGIHDFDVIQFRGKLYASTGAMVPPKATSPTSPGTLFVGDALTARWQLAYTYAGAPGEYAVRLGYMTRFRDRLYVAISPLLGKDTNDYVVIEPKPSETTLSQEQARAVRGTPSGGSHTLRWYADREKLYWITLGADGGLLQVTSDGESFTRIALPPEAGRPSDILRVGEKLVVMCERALLQIVDGGTKELAKIEDKKTPFKVDDAYCAPPLVVFDGVLYTGGQRKGELWKLEAD